jgi:hypothetical protein
MRVLLFILCIAEVLLLTFFQNVAGLFVSPLLFFLISICIAFVYLKVSTLAIKQKQIKKTADSIIKIAQIFLFVSISVIIFICLKNILDTHDCSLKNTTQPDMIPQIIYLVTRFLSGEQPYYPMPFVGYHLYPTYLPLQWFPYIIAEVLKVDYRWIPALFLWLVSLYFFIKNGFGNKAFVPAFWRIVVPIWPLFFWLQFIIYDWGFFSYAVEGLVASYYLLVCMSFNNKKITWVAIGITLCLLSRYSIVFWVPLCLACYYIAGQKKQVLIILGTIVVSFFVFYWLPFLRKDPSIFINGYHYHTKAAVDIWVRHDVVNGLGFKTWGEKWLPGPPEIQLLRLKKIHFGLCVLTIAGLFILFLMLRKKYPLGSFLLFSLKIYLTVFYAFIQLPFPYIYFVPVLISSALLANTFFRQREDLRPLRE